MNPSLAKMLGMGLILGGLNFAGCRYENKYHQVADIIKKEGWSERENLSFLKFKQNNKIYDLKHFQKYGVLEVSVSDLNKTETFCDYGIDGMNKQGNWYFIEIKNTNFREDAYFLETKENGLKKLTAETISDSDDKTFRKISERYDSLMFDIPSLYEEYKNSKKK